MRAIIAACALLCACAFSAHASWIEASTLFGPAIEKPLGPKPRASCGWHMRKLHGGRHGPEFNRARQWATLPRVAPGPGAVVVSSRKGRGCGGLCGHVVKIKYMIGKCLAMVTDNRGTYERDICRNRVAVVQP